MTTPSLVRFLLLDDLGSRNKQFKDHVSDATVRIRTAFEANELEGVKDQLGVLDGAIVDFHLSTPKKSGYPYLRYPCTAAECPSIVVSERYPADYVARAKAEHHWHATAGIPPVDVTTGLGAMCYIKQHAPEVPLFGFCELSAEHSLLFLLAAQTWLGAGAINAEDPPEVIRRALSSDEPERHLPIMKQLRAAESGFERLTNSLDFLTRDVEAWDWLGEFRFCPRVGTRAEFERRLFARFSVRGLEPKPYQRLMRRWQLTIAEILQAFNKDVNGWPDVTHVESAKHWDEHNPVLDFVQNGNWQTFFTEPDVRSALAYYRENEKRQPKADEY